MARKIVALEYNELVDDWLPIPLDDADPWTMQLANLVNGRNLTDEEFARTIELFNGQCHTRVDN